MSRLQEKYNKEVIPALMEKFGYKNIMQVPKLEKIVVNMG
ncbi:50S ribosomal protein L5, partial [Clostridium botulinum C]|nr:50S ribosomal protein L5 [Clostridium botulinum C]